MGWHTSTPKKDKGEKLRKGKRLRQRINLPTLSLAINVLIGDEEQKKETGSGSPTQIP